MSLWKIAWRSIQQRALASSLTGLSMALGVALVVALLVAKGVIEDSFTRGAGGYHLIVGKKGSQLQLVLNTVYHLSDPIENLPYTLYKELITSDGRPGKFAPYVKLAVPYCLGDNYEGFRVVGTTPDLFDKLEFAGGKKYAFQPGGRNFRAENFFEAVIGHTVARKTGLAIGDEFQPTHGLSDEGDGHKHDAFRVVGILEPTGTANDRALFINMEGFYLLDKHAKPVDVAHDADQHRDDHADEHPRDKHAHEGHAHDEHKHEGDAHDEHKHEGHGHEAHEPHPLRETAAGTTPRHDDHDHAAEEAKHHEHAHEGEHDHDHADREHGGHEHADGPSDSAHDHEHAEAQHDHKHDHEHGDHNHDHGDHDHAGHHHHHDPLPEDQREVTAILVLASNDLSAQGLATAINEGVEAQAVSPIRVIQDFFKTIVSGVSIALLALTVLIIVVAGIGVMVSIYNSMNDRRRDIAVMRALGAGRGTVMRVILLESVLLSLGSGLVGFLLGHGLVAALGPVVETFSGVSMGFAHFVPYEFVLIPGLIVLASLVGYLPAVSAYRTDVAKALSSSP